MEQITVPDVAGQDSETAFTTLGDAGFAVREVTESSSSVSSGKVTRTDPPAGTQAPRGATVRMFVSSGAPQVEVPEVRGRRSGGTAERGAAGRYVRDDGRA